MKKIKLSLITLFGITLSATTISSLTGCTNNNEIKNYYLTGGSTLLNGVYGIAGSDTKSWQLSLDEKIITDNIDWTISFPFADGPDGMSINKGIVSWSDNIPIGEYYFFVIATYDGLHISSGGSITLNIS